MSPFLSVEDLTKTFGGLRAVDRCSLEVREGTITGLIGPNGAGKTTLFNLLTGFHRPDGGRALFRGDDITGLPPHTISPASSGSKSSSGLRCSPTICCASQSC